MNQPSQMQSEKTVLYVDDEEQNLVSFKASFRRNFTVLIAKNGAEALELLKTNEVQVLLTDQRMPGVSGVELLEKVAELYPNVIRIIVTGYTDTDSVIKAINKGGAYRYISKPWETEELLLTLYNAFETYNLRQENRNLLNDLKSINQELEERVINRTSEVQDKNKELEKSKKDIARQKNELKRKNKELVELDKEKNHFIGIVAHDLKSPLNQIKGLIRILQLSSSALADSDKEILQKINDTAEGMHQMIGQILDISALENKKVRVKPERFLLQKLIDELTEEQIKNASKKSIELVIPTASAIGEVNLDRNYLKQILDNLLSNAIKFSPQNKSVFLRANKTNDKLRFEIEDQGPGISESDQKKLFRKFQKLTAKPTAGEHSSGLGLSIVKKFVETMNGQVWCESEEGKGATFFVELPIK